MVYAMIPIIMITGIIMVFHLGTTLVQWAMLLHFLAAGTVVSGLLIHVYMGAVFPEERPAFYSMITGMVDELYAYRHHFKWWHEVKIMQREWEAEQNARVGLVNSDGSEALKKSDKHPAAPAKSEQDHT